MDFPSFKLTVFHCETTSHQSPAHSSSSMLVTTRPSLEFSRIIPAKEFKTKWPPSSSQGPLPQKGATRERPGIIHHASHTEFSFSLQFHPVRETQTVRMCMRASGQPLMTPCSASSRVPQRSMAAHRSLRGTPHSHDNHRAVCAVDYLPVQHEADDGKAGCPLACRLQRRFTPLPGDKDTSYYNSRRLFDFETAKELGDGMKTLPRNHVLFLLKQNARELEVFAMFMTSLEFHDVHFALFSKSSEVLPPLSSLRQASSPTALAARPTAKSLTHRVPDSSQLCRRLLLRPTRPHPRPD